MAQEIVMPRLSDSMEEGTIVTWLKEVGDEVAMGEDLVEIETDKATMVYESDAAGTLIEVLAEENATLAVGAVIARVGAAGETSGGAGESTDGQPARQEQPQPAQAKMRGTTQGDVRVKASPLARRIARDRGVDLAAVQGSGAGGRIVKADVKAVLASGSDERTSPPSGSETPSVPRLSRAPAAPVQRETAKGDVQVVELTKLQHAVARRMAESKATAPHFYLSCDVDMARCVEARARIRAASGQDDVVPSFNDMVVKAAALALRAFPRANGSYRDGRWELYSRVNVGIAVAAPDALVVPTIFDADQKGLRQIAAESRALALRVRDQTITPPELSGGTFAISNLGMHGVSSFQAVINPPHAGILAVGEIREEPVVRGGEITAAHLMSLTLACDHRILYGAEGAEFLGRIRALLEEPLRLAL